MKFHDFLQILKTSTVNIPQILALKLKKTFRLVFLGLIEKPQVKQQRISTYLFTKLGVTKLVDICIDIFLEGRSFPKISIQRDSKKQKKT